MKLCLGADLFGGIPTPAIDHLRPFFQEAFSQSSCYPHFLTLLEQEFLEQQVRKIAYKNAQAFLKRQNLLEEK